MRRAFVGGLVGLSAAFAPWLVAEPPRAEAAPPGDAQSDASAMTACTWRVEGPLAFDATCRVDQESRLRDAGGRVVEIHSAATDTIGPRFFAIIALSERPQLPPHMTLVYVRDGLGNGWTNFDFVTKAVITRVTRVVTDGHAVDEVHGVIDGSLPPSEGHGITPLSIHVEF
jgi:hypothetical protein